MRLSLLRTIAALAALALAVTGIACGGDDDDDGTEAAPAPSAKELPAGDIVIGAAVAKSGFQAAYDAGLGAIKLQIKDLNASGGIDGHQIKLIEADTRSDVQRGAAAAQELIDKGAQIMLVSCDLSLGSPAALVATDAGLLTFTLCAADPEWNPPAFKSLAFSTFGSLESEGAAGAQYLREDQGVEKPFLLVDTYVDYGINACAAYQGYIEHEGGTIAGKATFKNDDPSISGQIAQIRNSDADGLALCSYPPGGVAALKQLRAAGIDLPIWGPQGFDGTYWIESVPTLSNFYFTTGGSIFGDDPRPEVNETVKDLVDRGAQDTTAIAAYSAMQAIETAIKSAGSLDGEVLAKELETFKDEPLLIGPTTYTDKLHVPNREWLVMEIQNGKQSFVTTVTPDYVPSISDE
jgi:branched-chain amino acid transport system substrate-binding protein